MALPAAAVYGLVGAGVSALGAGFSAGNAAITNAYNSGLMKKQFNYNKQLMKYQSDLNKDFSTWNYENSYSLQRKGLESAGYNPLLAIQSSPSASTPVAGSSVSGQSAPAGDIGTGITNASKIMMDKARLASEIDATNAGASLAREQASTEAYRRQLMATESTLNDIRSQLGRKDLSWADRRYLAEVENSYINSSANWLQAQSSATNAHTAKLQYSLNRELSEYEKTLKYENERVLRIKNDYYDGHPVRQFFREHVQPVRLR